LDRLNPQAGGAETHLHETFGRLACWGHEVTVLASGFPGGPPVEALDGMEVHRVGSRMTFGLHVPFAIKSLLRGRSFDIQVEDLNKVPMYLPAWNGTQTVLLVHHLFGTTAFQEASFPMAATTWLMEKTIPRAFRGLPVVAVSESTARDLRARGMTESAIEVIPNGVDLQLFRPEPDSVRFPEPTILYLGRLKRYKRIDLIIRAVAALKQDGFGVRLLVGGKGDHEGILKSLVDDLEIGDLVRFLGYVSEEDKIEAYQRAWVHVLTSPKEGWGISILEAAACGTPSIASDAPGLRDAVRDGTTGVLVPHGDVPRLASQLRGLLSSDTRREDMGRAARELAREFSWDASARRMEAYLEDRVAAGHPQT
jgi:glycosyltransferase involved in cell wall biosynthesis